MGEASQILPHRVRFFFRLGKLEGGFLEWVFVFFLAFFFKEIDVLDCVVVVVLDGLGGGDDDR